MKAGSWGEVLTGTPWDALTPCHSVVSRCKHVWLSGKEMESVLPSGSFGYRMTLLYCAVIIVVQDCTE